MNVQGETCPCGLIFVPSFGEKACHDELGNDLRKPHHHPPEKRAYNDWLWLGTTCHCGHLMDEHYTLEPGETRWFCDSCPCTLLAGSE